MFRHAIPDVIAIIAFSILARFAHQSAAMPFNAAGVLATAWPFLLGVVIATAIVVLLKLDGVRIVPAGLIVWVVTVATGLGIWALRHAAAPHWSFIIVASSTSAVLLLGWRLVARFLPQKTAEI